MSCHVHGGFETRPMGTAGLKTRPTYERMTIGT